MTALLLPGQLILHELVCIEDTVKSWFSSLLPNLFPLYQRVFYHPLDLVQLQHILSTSFEDFQELHVLEVPVILECKGPLLSLWSSSLLYLPSLQESWLHTSCRARPTCSWSHVLPRPFVKGLLCIAPVLYRWFLDILMQNFDLESCQLTNAVSGKVKHHSLLAELQLQWCSHCQRTCTAETHVSSLPPSWEKGVSCLKHTTGPWVLLRSWAAHDLLRVIQNQNRHYANSWASPWLRRNPSRLTQAVWYTSYSFWLTRMSWTQRSSFAELCNHGRTWLQAFYY